MNEQIIKDFYGRIIGYIRTAPNGDQIAYDFYHVVLGYYDARQNVTRNFYRQVIAQGNVLSGLVYQSGKK